MSKQPEANRFDESLTADGRYRLLVEAVTDYAIYMLNVDGIVSSWNPGARRFKGYEEAEIVGQHFSRFYTPEDRATGLPERALAAARDEGKFEGEGWRVRKDGGRFWASVVIDPIRNRQGDLVGYAKITRDLTERKAAESPSEAARSSSSSWYRVSPIIRSTCSQLRASSPVGTPAPSASRDMRRKRLLGSTSRGFTRMKTEQSGEPERALATATHEGRSEKEGWRIRKNGERFWAHVVIDAIHDDEGKLIGFAKITRDITERRDAQAALDRAREALFQSQKMEAVGQLTGGIAHDFNNLLAAILGSLEIVRRRVTDESVARLIENAIRGAQRGAALTQRMLVFARRHELKFKRSIFRCWCEA